MRTLGTAIADLWRLQALQLSWNRRTMQDLGWITVCLPKLSSPEQRQELVRGESGFRNTNPYLAGLLLGSVVRAHADGEIQRLRPFADAVSRNLGAAGDALFWTGLRPAMMLWAAVGVLLGWWPAVLVLLVIFAAASAGLRLWLFRRGERLGYAIISDLDSGVFQRATSWSRGLAWGAGGAVLALLALFASVSASGVVELGSVAAAAAALLLGVLTAWRGLRLEWVLVIATTLIWLGLSWLG
jgi:mannose/fructose/N-acetylgalactosamine-specific phosphotransferase system component IID